MSEQTKPHGLRRSVGAVVTGFVATALLSLGTDVVMHATGVFPPWGEPMSDGLFVWATVYRVAFTVLGGLVTARLAPRKPMMHVPEFGPKWYPISLIVTALPCVWAGGLLAGASGKTEMAG